MGLNFVALVLLTFYLSHVIDWACPLARYVASTHFMTLPYQSLLSPHLQNMCTCPNMTLFFSRASMILAMRRAVFFENRCTFVVCYLVYFMIGYSWERFVHCSENTSSKIVRQPNFCRDSKIARIKTTSRRYVAFIHRRIVGPSSFRHANASLSPSFHTLCRSVFISDCTPPIVS